MLKYIIAAAIAVNFTASASQAQTATSGSASAAQAGAQAASGAASLSGVVINQTSPGTLKYEGEYTVKSAPAVSAPALFGGGHPCLAGRSGGVSVIGGGISYGQGDPEPACMAWVMGQPEVAIRIMMASSPRFCEAMNNVGYYRVGNAVVPVACGKQTKRGGVDTPGVSSRPTKLSTRSAVTYTAQAVCNRSGGKLKYSIDAHFANRAAAKANCKARLRN